MRNKENATVQKIKELTEDDEIYTREPYDNRKCININNGPRKCIFYPSNKQAMGIYTRGQNKNHNNNLNNNVLKLSKSDEEND